MGAGRGLLRLAPPVVRRGQHAVVGSILAILLTSAPMTLVVWVASFRHTPQAWPNWPLFSDLYPNVLVVCAVLIALLKLLRVTPRAPVRTQTSGRSPAERLLDRLPHELGRDVLALEMEDHYVRVHTARGSALVLMRMRDAVDALSAWDGARVHRSWWVSRSAVAGSERDGRTVRLVLQNGLKVPVPRDRAPELRREGWLSGTSARPAVSQLEAQ